MLIPNCPFCGFTLRELNPWTLAQELRGTPGYGPALQLLREVGAEAVVLMCDSCQIWGCVA